MTPQYGMAIIAVMVSTAALVSEALVRVLPGGTGHIVAALGIVAGSATAEHFDQVGKKFKTGYEGLLTPSDLKLKVTNIVYATMLSTMAMGLVMRPSLAAVLGAVGYVLAIHILLR